jgi:hypothetical protein
MPPDPLRLTNIPKNPKINIGKREYPKVLITPYSGTISF